MIWRLNCSEIMPFHSAMEEQESGTVIKRLSVPVGLEELMSGLAKEVLQKKPKDIYNFASEYFGQLLSLRDNGNYNVPPSEMDKPIVTGSEQGSKRSSSDSRKVLSRQISIYDASPKKKQTKKSPRDRKGKKSSNKLQPVKEKPAPAVQSTPKASTKRSGTPHKQTKRGSKDAKSADKESGSKHDKDSNVNQSKDEDGIGDKTSTAGLLALQGLQHSGELHDVIPVHTINMPQTHSQNVENEPSAMAEKDGTEPTSIPTAADDSIPGQDSGQMEKAATLIQAGFRGYLTRKRRDVSKPKSPKAPSKSPRSKSVGEFPNDKATTSILGRSLSVTDSVISKTLDEEDDKLRQSVDETESLQEHSEDLGIEVEKSTTQAKDDLNSSLLIEEEMVDGNDTEKATGVDAPQKHNITEVAVSNEDKESVMENGTLATEPTHEGSAPSDLSDQKEPDDKLSGNLQHSGEMHDTVIPHMICDDKADQESDNLKHSGEMHDTILISSDPLQPDSINAEAQQPISNSLQHSGEMHDSVIPVIEIYEQQSPDTSTQDNINKSEATTAETPNATKFFDLANEAENKTITPMSDAKEELVSAQAEISSDNVNKANETIELRGGTSDTQLNVERENATETHDHQNSETIVVDNSKVDSDEKEIPTSIDCDDSNKNLEDGQTEKPNVITSVDEDKEDHDSTNGTKLSKVPAAVTSSNAELHANHELKHSGEMHDTIITEDDTSIDTSEHELQLCDTTMDPEPIQSSTLQHSSEMHDTPVITTLSDAKDQLQHSGEMHDTVVIHSPGTDESEVREDDREALPKILINTPSYSIQEDSSDSDLQHGGEMHDTLAVSFDPKKSYDVDSPLLHHGEMHGTIVTDSVEPTAVRSPINQHHHAAVEATSFEAASPQLGSVLNDDSAKVTDNLQHSGEMHDSIVPSIVENEESNQQRGEKHDTGVIELPTNSTVEDTGTILREDSLQHSGEMHDPIEAAVVGNEEIENNQQVDKGLHHSEEMHESKPLTPVEVTSVEVVTSQLGAVLSEDSPKIADNLQHSGEMHDSIEASIVGKEESAHEPNVEGDLHHSGEMHDSIEASIFKKEESAQEKHVEGDLHRSGEMHDLIEASIVEKEKEESAQEKHVEGDLHHSGEMHDSIEASIVKKEESAHEPNVKGDLHHSGEMHDSIEASIVGKEESANEQNVEGDLHHSGEMHDSIEASIVGKEASAHEQNVEGDLHHSGEMHDSIEASIVKKEESAHEPNVKGDLHHSGEMHDSIEASIVGKEESANEQNVEGDLHHSGEMHDSIEASIVGKEESAHEQSVEGDLHHSEEMHDSIAASIVKKEESAHEPNVEGDLHHSGEMHDSIEASIVEKEKEQSAQEKHVEGVLHHSGEMHDSIEASIVGKEESAHDQNVEGDLHHSGEMHDSIEASIVGKEESAHEQSVEGDLHHSEEMHDSIAASIVKKEESAHEPNVEGDLHHSGEMHDSIEASIVEKEKEQSAQEKHVEGVLHHSGEMHDSIEASIVGKEESAHDQNVEGDLHHSGEMHDSIEASIVEKEKDESAQEKSVEGDLHHSGEMHDSIEASIVEKDESAQEKNVEGDLHHSGEIHDTVLSDLRSPVTEVNEEVPRKDVKLEHSGEMHDTVVFDPPTHASTTPIPKCEKASASLQSNEDIHCTEESTTHVNAEVRAENHVEGNLQHSGEMHDTTMIASSTPAPEGNQSAVGLQHDAALLDTEKQDQRHEEVKLQHSGEMHDTPIIELQTNAPNPESNDAALTPHNAEGAALSHANTTHEEDHLAEGKLEHSGEMHDSAIIEIQKETPVSNPETVVTLQHSGEMHDAVILSSFDHESVNHLDEDEDEEETHKDTAESPNEGKNEVENKTESAHTLESKNLKASAVEQYPIVDREVEEKLGAPVDKEEKSNHAFALLLESNIKEVTQNVKRNVTSTRAEDENEDLSNKSLIDNIESQILHTDPTTQQHSDKKQEEFLNEENENCNEGTDNKINGRNTIEEISTTFDSSKLREEIKNVTTPVVDANENNAKISGQSYVNENESSNTFDSEKLRSEVENANKHSENGDLDVKEVKETSDKGEDIPTTFDVTKLRDEIENVTKSEENEEKVTAKENIENEAPVTFDSSTLRNEVENANKILNNGEEEGDNKADGTIVETPSTFDSVKLRDEITNATLPAAVNSEANVESDNYMVAENPPTLNASKLHTEVEDAGNNSENSDIGDKNPLHSTTFVSTKLSDEVKHGTNHVADGDPYENTEEKREERSYTKENYFKTSSSFDSSKLRNELENVNKQPKENDTDTSRTADESEKNDMIGKYGVGQSSTSSKLRNEVENASKHLENDDSDDVKLKESDEINTSEGKSGQKELGSVTKQSDATENEERREMDGIAETPISFDASKLRNEVENASKYLENNDTSQTIIGKTSAVFDNSKLGDEVEKTITTADKNGGKVDASEDDTLPESSIVFDSIHSQDDTNLSTNKENSEESNLGLTIFDSAKLRNEIEDATKPTQTNTEEELGVKGNTEKNSTDEVLTTFDPSKLSDEVENVSKDLKNGDTNNISEEKNSDIKEHTTADTNNKGGNIVDNTSGAFNISKLRGEIENAGNLVENENLKNIKEESSGQEPSRTFDSSKLRDEVDNATKLVSNSDTEDTNDKDDRNKNDPVEESPITFDNSKLRQDIESVTKPIENEEVSRSTEQSTIDELPNTFDTDKLHEELETAIKPVEEKNEIKVPQAILEGTSTFDSTKLRDEIENASTPTESNSKEENSEQKGDIEETETSFDSSKLRNEIENATKPRSAHSNSAKVRGTEDISEPKASRGTFDVSKLRDEVESATKMANGSEEEIGMDVSKVHNVDEGSMPYDSSKLREEIQNATKSSSKVKEESAGTRETKANGYETPITFAISDLHQEVQSAGKGPDESNLHSEPKQLSTEEARVEESPPSYDIAQLHSEVKTATKVPERTEADDKTLGAESAVEHDNDTVSEQSTDAKDNVSHVERSEVNEIIKTHVNDPVYKTNGSSEERSLSKNSSTSNESTSTIIYSGSPDHGTLTDNTIDSDAAAVSRAKRSLGSSAPRRSPNVDAIISPRNRSQKEGAIAKTLGDVFDQQFAIASPLVKLEEQKPKNGLNDPEYIYIPLKDPNDKEESSLESESTLNAENGEREDFGVQSDGDKSKQDQGNNALYAYQFQGLHSHDDDSEMSTIIRTTHISDDALPLAVQLNQGPGLQQETEKSVK
ncbi:uncharacterized protein LOC116177766 isoform X2 [Photinus pyralis]|uniref:uncharacterized protein LOC116177766 isoform X2 n=1 Tax=Photinus pyralis TaxID=7054 RepID=UPI0012674950|nr:uncharacterized protein LOC116177766 isoform X2 [Photinus pyralis]